MFELDAGAVAVRCEADLDLGRGTVRGGPPGHDEPVRRFPDQHFAPVHDGAVVAAFIDPPGDAWFQDWLPGGGVSDVAPGGGSGLSNRDGQPTRARSVRLVYRKGRRLVAFDQSWLLSVVVVVGRVLELGQRPLPEPLEVGAELA